jgi:cell division protein FtsB
MTPESVRKRFGRVARVATRALVLAVAGALLSLIGLQYARVIGQNIALARSLHDVQTDIANLQAKRVQQEQEIRRLSDPRGAIPEIHDRLHLVGKNEAIIYLKGVPEDGP